MNQQDKFTKHNFQRRNFLKQVAGSGSVLTASLLSGSLISNSLLGANYPAKKFASDVECGFSNLDPDFIYLNSGTEGSMPKCVIEQLNESLNQWASDPTTSYETDETLGKHQHLQRTKVAELFSVKKDNVCLTDNTTMGLNMVLMGINFKPTDKVIFTNHEHTAIVSPLTFQQQKIGLKLVKRSFPKTATLSKMNTQQLIEFLFPNIDELRDAKALCVSHVYPTTGVRLPLQALRKKAKQLNIQYLIVDGAQAFGVIDITQGEDDIKHTDFYACPGHKWLNGPPSTGILYIKNSKIKPPEFYPSLSQRMEKFLDTEKPFAMAEALQVRGCSNTPGFSAMLTAISFQQDIGGARNIEKRILEMSNKVKSLIKSLSSEALVSPFKEPQLLSGLTVFYPFNWNKPEQIYTDKDTADKVVKRLLKKNIQIRSIGFFDSINATEKSYALRVSTAIFNTNEHIQQFEDSIKEVLVNL